MKGTSQENESSITNIINGPAWIKLRNLIVAELEPYPEAKAAILAALERVNE